MYLETKAPFQLKSLINFNLLGVILVDEYFIVFEKWYRSKVKEWNADAIYVEKWGLATHAHQYHIELSSKLGLGIISLHESNGFYWVDFEAGVFKDKEMFFRVNIPFSGEKV